MSERTSKLKARVFERRAILLPGVANALSARIAEDAGFEALYVTGAGISNMNLGVPDIGLLTLNDVVDAVLRIGDATELPIVVDADTGFGNAVNVHNTVRRLEQAGASAIQLEDQVFPKRCGHFEGKAVVPVEEMLGKIRAAVDARRNADLQIIARTDARAVDGFEAAIERAQAFAEAGADITFVEALTSPEEMEQAPRRIACPQMLNIVFGGKTPALPIQEIERLGYVFVLYANAALQAAIAGMQRVLGELHRTGSLNGVEEALASFAVRQQVVRKDVFDQLEARYVK